MATFGKLWAGRAYGTNTGNLFVEFSETDPTLAGTLRLMDEQFGLAAYEVLGKFDGSLELTGTWIWGADEAQHGVLTITGALTSEGSIRGKWTSTIGTGGTFSLHPHDTSAMESNSEASTIPEQIFTRNIQIGSIRLYAPDVLELIRFVSQDFAVGRPVITYKLRGGEVIKYADDFVKDFAVLDELDYLKITNQETEAHGINRIAIVEFNAFGINEVRVQGVRESWVIGRAQSIVEYLRRYENGLVTNYRRFGLNINSVIFIAALVTFPEIRTLGNRSAFAVAVFSLLMTLLWIHRKFIPNVSISLNVQPPSRISRAWPTILSWVVAASASLAAALIFKWLA